MEETKPKIIKCGGGCGNDVIEEQPYGDETLCQECSDTIGEMMEEGTL